MALGATQPSVRWYWWHSGGWGGLKLTSHPNLLQRLSINEASYTSSSPHSFMACTGTALPEFSNTDSTAKLTYFQWEIVQSLWLGRKWSWSILKYCFQHLPECSQENQKNVVRMLFIVDYVWSDTLNGKYRHILYILSGSQNSIALLFWVLSMHIDVCISSVSRYSCAYESVSAHTCAYEFCYCTSTFLWVVSAHPCAYEFCQFTSMGLWVVSIHIHVVMSSLTAHTCGFEFCQCTAL